MTFLRKNWWLPLTVAYVGLLAAAAVIGEVL